MSIIIKGMDMPSRCEECVYEGVAGSKLDEYFCILTQTKVLGHGIARLDDCPLVEIPTPHGRLIDRDAVPEVSADPYEEGAFQDTLDDMPIFLEAEE